MMASEMSESLQHSVEQDGVESDKDESVSLLPQGENHQSINQSYNNASIVSGQGTPTKASQKTSESEKDIFNNIFYTVTVEQGTPAIVVVVVVVDINSPNIGTPRIEWNKVKC